MDKSYAKIHTDKIEHRKCLSLYNVCMYWMWGYFNAIVWVEMEMHACATENQLDISERRSCTSTLFPLFITQSESSSSFFHFIWNVHEHFQYYFSTNIFSFFLFFMVLKRSMLDLNSLITANTLFPIELKIYSKNPNAIAWIEAIWSNSRLSLFRDTKSNFNCLPKFPDEYSRKAKKRERDFE